MKLYLLVLCLISQTVMPLVQTNRDVIILCECGDNENINKTYADDSVLSLKGYGAITNAFTTALWQEAAPIIVPAALLSNITEHKKLFNAFTDPAATPAALQTQYGAKKCFDTIEKITKFQQQCLFVKKQYADLQTVVQKNDNETAASQFIVFNLLFQNAQAPQDTARLDILMGIIFCPFSRYIIHKIPAINWYILIPKSYVDARAIALEDLGFKNLASTVYMQDMPTDSQLYKNVPHKPIVELLNSNLVSPYNCYEQLIDNLPSIFMTKQPETDYPYTWAVILAGHGNFIAPMSTDEFLKQKLTLLTQRTEKKQRITRITHSDGDEAQKQKLIATVNTEIEQITVRINALNQQLYKSHIAGMPLPYFNKLITFLNTKIVTSMLFYTSCGAGGQNMIDPYKELTSEQPFNLSYAIAGAAITEASTYIATPKITIPLYNGSSPVYSNTTLDDALDFATKKIKLSTPLNYTAYYAELRKDQAAANYKPISYTQLFSYIDDFLPKKPVPPTMYQVVNIPSLRLPGMEWFSILDADASILRLTNVKIKAQGGKPLVINGTKKPRGIKTVLVDAITIDCPIILQGSDIPTILSTAVGTTHHFFKQIHTPAAPLQRVVAAFFHENVHFMAAKLFEIGELITRDGTYYGVKIVINKDEKHGIFGKEFCTTWATDAPVPAIQPPSTCTEAMLQSIITFFDVKATVKPGHFGAINLTDSLPTQERLFKQMGETIFAGHQKKLSTQLQENLTQLAESLQALHTHITRK